MILIDSDHLSVLLELRDQRRELLLSRLRGTPEVRGIPIVVIEEQVRGWLAQIRRSNDVHRQIVPYMKFGKAIDFLLDWTTVGWTEPAANEFKRHRASGIRIGSQDLKIACIALANDAVLLSANLRDFEQVPDLRVEDWLR